MTRSNDFQLLTSHLKKELKKQGLAPDKYDPDFILGTLMQKLGDMNAALTKSGVRRFKK